MEMFLVLTVHILLVYAVTAADQWMKFQRIRSLDGNVCQGAEVAFFEKNANDISICVRKCENNANCMSIFHVQHAGMCTGCTVSYDTTSYLIGQSSGSIYYGKNNCPEGWFKIETSCYFITEATTFTEGTNECNSLDAHPVIMETIEENNNLKLMFRSMTFSGNFDGFLTAFTDIAAEGTWVVDGSTSELTFDDWGRDEPNQGTYENCLMFWRWTDWQWNDGLCQCTHCHYKTICEREN